MKQIAKLIVATLLATTFPAMEISAGSITISEKKQLKEELYRNKKEYDQLVKQDAPKFVLQRENKDITDWRERIEKLDNVSFSNKMDELSETQPHHGKLPSIDNLIFAEDESQLTPKHNNSPASKVKPNEVVTLTVSSDGATKNEALKNALRTAIEQAYGAFVSANTTILNDELVKDEIVTVSNGSIKNYKEISSFKKPDGSGYMMTVNATVSLPHLITYAKNHGSECEFAGNTFSMELKLFNLQKENELKALYNAIPVIENIAKTTLHWDLQVEEPKIIDFERDIKTKTENSVTFADGMLWTFRDEVLEKNSYNGYHIGDLLNTPSGRKSHPYWQVNNNSLKNLENMSNGQYALVKMNLFWIPNGEEYELIKYLESLFSKLSINHTIWDKYNQQGHNSGFIHSFWHRDHSYYMRSSNKEIALWMDSVWSTINRVKNNFEIMDNTGQVSTFYPRSLSVFFDIYRDWSYANEYFNENEKHKFIQMNSEKIKSFINIDRGKSRSSYIVPNTNFNFAWLKGTTIGIGGSGLFNRLFYLDFNKQYHIEYLIDKRIISDPFGGEYTRLEPTWVLWIYIPLSEIGKYSSFKIVAKE